MVDDGLAGDSLDELLALTEDALAVGGSSRSPGARSADPASPASRGPTSYTSAPQDPAEAAWGVLEARAKNENGPRHWREFLSRRDDWAIAEHRVGSEGSRSVTTELYFLPTALDLEGGSEESIQCTPVHSAEIFEHSTASGSSGSMLEFAEDGWLHKVPLVGPTERLRLLPGGVLEPEVQDPADAAWAKMQRVYNGQGRSWGDTAERQGDWAVARRETHSESSASVSTSLHFLPTWTSTGTRAVRCTTKYENDHGERGSIICFSSKRPGVVAEVHMGDEPTEYFRLLPDGTLEPVDDLTDALL